MEVFVAERPTGPFFRIHRESVQSSISGSDVPMASLFFLTRYHSARKVLVVEANLGV